MSDNCRLNHIEPDSLGDLLRAALVDFPSVSLWSICSHTDTWQLGSCRTRCICVSFFVKYLLTHRYIVTCFEPHSLNLLQFFREESAHTQRVASSCTRWIFVSFFVKYLLTHRYIIYKFVRIGVHLVIPCNIKFLPQPIMRLFFKVCKILRRKILGRPRFCCKSYLWTLCREKLLWKLGKVVFVV